MCWTLKQARLVNVTRDIIHRLLITCNKLTFLYMKKFYALIALSIVIVSCGTPSKVASTSNLSNLSPVLDESIMVPKQEMLDLLLKYLVVESGSKEVKEGYPMTEGQMEMAKLLKSDIEGLGLPATLTEWGYVYAEIPSNIEKDVPVFGISCHLDYTPEAPGTGIKPSVITYNGGDIKLGDGSVISPSTPEGAELPNLVGKTLIHSDGTTLLGGDDKNGCAIVMSVLKTALNPAMKHGKIQFVFCPNEDIGKAAERIDPDLFNPDILYDVDGMGGHEVTSSNFTARGMKVKFTGHDAHPAEAKAQKYGDALAAAATYIGMVPMKYRPEHTEGFGGYIHHWNLTADKVHHEDTVSTRIRYFDSKEGEKFDHIINESLNQVRKKFPNVKVDVIWDETQYDNVEYSMYAGSRQIIDRAAARCGQTIEYKAERGGTTAAMFTAKGLKGGMCIFSGQHNCHKVHEYSCLEEMMDAYKLLLCAIDEVTLL